MNDEDLRDDVSDAWWIDYLEGEWGEDLKPEFETLLKHSQKHRERLEKYKTLKWLVKWSETDWTEKSDEYFKDFNTNVMTKIENYQPSACSEEEKWQKQQEAPQRLWLRD